MKFLELYKKGKLIAAHRGASGSYPENTISAIRGCIGKSDFIEVDIQLSQDKKAVVIHDDELLRTTNISQLPFYKNRNTNKVTDYSFEELLKLDCGSWFYGYEKKEPLLSLHDLLVFAKKNSLYLNIELKDIHNYFDDKETVMIVLKEIEKQNMVDNVLISSFRDNYLKLLKEVSQNIPTALIVEKDHPKDIWSYLESLGVEAYHMEYKLVNKQIMEELKLRGYFVGVYSVDDISLQKELFGMGVDAVFSNL